MKKYIGLLLALICIFTLTTCSNDKKIVLPDPKNISEIELIKINSNKSTKITDQNQIAEFINKIINNTKSTDLRSVNDQPTNIDNYIIIKFSHINMENNTSKAYMYKKKNIYFIEQPYAGIWRLEKQMFDSIGNEIIR